MTDTPITKRIADKIRQHQENKYKQAIKTIKPEYDIQTGIERNNAKH